MTDFIKINIFSLFTIYISNEFKALIMLLPQNNANLQNSVLYCTRGK